jgi:hypothetical protein
MTTIAASQRRMYDSCANFCALKSASTIGYRCEVRDSSTLETHTALSAPSVELIEFTLSFSKRFRNSRPPLNHVIYYSLGNMLRHL